VADHYPYRISTRTGELTVIWRSGVDAEPDTLLVDEAGRLRAFASLADLVATCEHIGVSIEFEGEGNLDLGAVRRWIRFPQHVSVSDGLVLEAWNFFEDLSRSIRTGREFPEQEPVHDSAYDKLFAGHARDPQRGADRWTAEESTAVRDLLAAGLVLWEHAVARARKPTDTSPA
jgi:hypothetical protein